MQKTIEERIAEGVAQGIQQAKDAEIEMKRKKGKDTLIGYALFFVIFFLSSFIVLQIRHTFGIDKHDFIPYVYPLAVIAQLVFTIFFYRKEFKTHFWGTFVMTLINSFGMGYFVALMIK